MITPATPMDSKLKKRLKGLGHDLHPVVTVAGNGLTKTVLAELSRALEDHELIKVKVAGWRARGKTCANCPDV